MHRCNMQEPVLFPELYEQLDKRERSRAEELAEMTRAAIRHGALIPPSLAAEVLDVSKQRAYELIEKGRLRRFDFFGKTWVCESDVLEFAASDRKAGRPMVKRNT